MNKRLAVFGDPHACHIELAQLISRLEWLSIDEIWSLGDNCDRGPDNAATFALLREKGIKSILGNHEDSILRHRDRVSRGGNLPHNEDKSRTLKELTPDDWEYIAQMPTIHVIDDLKLVLVHGGLFPGISLYKQPHNVIRAQMIHPDRPGGVRWWGKDAIHHVSGKNEDQNVQDGYRRWYELYDHEYDCVYGHSVFTQPFIHQNEGFGKTIGIDTGSCFGGSITAAIFDGSEYPTFMSVKARKVWFERSHRVHQE